MLGGVNTVSEIDKSDEDGPENPKELVTLSRGETGPLKVRLIDSEVRAAITITGCGRDKRNYISSVSIGSHVRTLLACLVGLHSEMAEA